MRPFIILGSASPRRKKLLKDFYQLKVFPAHCDERRKKDESPRAYVRRIAREKWKSVAAKMRDIRAQNSQSQIIVTADTTVSLKREILGKAKNAKHAKRILKKLSAKIHNVMTSVCVGWSAKSRPQFQILVTSKVKFKKLSEKDLKNYLHSGEWKDKAGAYAIQGRASKFAEKIQGSMTNIVGLPVAETKSLIAHCFSHPL
ncbi:MAG: septum formation protein Maf [Deltaproteobacteria bacterium]|nr:septum formation protein Maf [Deltaproteobacteria bacterium]